MGWKLDYGLVRKAAGLDRKAAGLESKNVSLESKTAGLDRKAAGLDRKAAGLESKTAGLESKAAGPPKVNFSAISGPKKVSIFRTHPFQWPSNWIFPHHNNSLHSAPYKQHRYINS
jgi:hypothetical protein